MKDSVCVSVIVPIYNQEKFLNQSIPSIINQSYNNIDIILVDDGSTDSSFDIINEYAKKDSRIQIVKKTNGGLVDATLAGIAVAKGELLCFLDPDDLWGKELVKTFVENFTEECDFVAMGFYFDTKGVLTPYYLREDHFYTKNDLNRFIDCYIYEEGKTVASNRFFGARWNKMYRTEIVRKVSEEFCNFKSVSIGEDSIFNYLVLIFSRGGKTITQPNGYFYNVANPNAMMRDNQIDINLSKSKSAFESLKSLTKKYNTDDSQAYALYYSYIRAYMAKAYESNRTKYHSLMKQFRNDADYKKAKKFMSAKPSLSKNYIKNLIISSPSFYLIAKRTYTNLRNIMQYIEFWTKKLIKKGPVRASRLLRYRIDRDTAYPEMNAMLPNIEERVLPILKSFLSQQTNLNECPIKKNIFVFWWDGFEKAPEIVKACLKSVKKHHPNCNVITIDKDNYEKYTDIDSCIIKDFKKDKISIQTFSDILRFNLLKNNGGIWIDSTIFFLSEFNLLNDLENKSFTSLTFSTSSEFLKYSGEECSWSGFFIASRKNGLFVRAVDEIFKRYYLKYKTYSTYFFIDIILMICKKYGLDDNALNKTMYSKKSMFALGALLNQTLNTDALEFIKDIPQKLAWNVKGIKSNNTFYEWILKQ